MLLKVELCETHRSLLYLNLLGPLFRAVIPLHSDNNKKVKWKCHCCTASFLPKNLWKLREIAIISSGENVAEKPVEITWNRHYFVPNTWPKNQWKLREIAIISYWKRGRKTSGNYGKSPLFRPENGPPHSPTFIHRKRGWNCEWKLREIAIISSRTRTSTFPIFYPPKTWLKLRLEITWNRHYFVPKTWPYKNVSNIPESGRVMT